LAILEFLFAQVGIIGRCHLRHGLTDADLPLEFKTVAGRLAHQLYCNRQFVAQALGGSGEVLSVYREVGDEAVLAFGTFLHGIADVEHRRRYGLALPGLLQDDVGVAVHHAIAQG